MSEDKRPGGRDKEWVDSDRHASKNAFDKDDGYSGQQYSREQEAAQGDADRARDVPHERTQAEHAPPRDPDDFTTP